MYPIYFKVEFIDEDDHEMKTETGFIYATSCANAAIYLDLYYGGDVLETVHVERLEEGPIIVPEPIAEKIIKEHF